MLDTRACSLTNSLREAASAGDPDCSVCPALLQVTLADFSRYLRSVGDRLETLERSREADQQRMQEALSPGAVGGVCWQWLGAVGCGTSRWLLLKPGHGWDACAGA